MRLGTVTSLGLVTAVGHDVVTACASHRAGIVRFAPVDGLKVYDPETLEAPVFGAPVKGVTDGFIQSGRWLRLAHKAVLDLVRYGDLPAMNDRAFWGRTALVWALPEIRYERFLWPEREVPRLLERACGELLAALLRAEFQPLPLAATYLCGGEVSVALAIQRLERLAQPPVERALILAVDSWLDPRSVDELLRERRLKTPEQSTGLMPGEAAACVLVEASTLARRHERAPVAQVLSAATGAAPTEARAEEAPSRSARSPEIGKRTARVMIDAVRAAGLRAPFHGDLVVDLNGEAWKAQAWGYAQVAFRAAGWLGATREVIPATSFGDVGAASGGAAVCLAARAFQRGYASGRHALLVSVSDQGHAGAIVLGAAE